MPLSLRQRADLRKGIGDRAPARLVRDDVQAGRSVDLLLHETGDYLAKRKDLKVISSSNPLLLTGVMDTVKTWKYKPTLLNKEPVEVITTITVNFTLGR